jgi:streptogramin lyase
MKRVLTILAVALAILPAASATAAEEVTQSSFALGPATRADALTVGPDGNLWFVAHRWESEDVVLGKETTSGDVTEFRLPIKGPSGSIVAGREGDLWFAEGSGIGRATPDGEVTSFPLPEGSSHPTAMAVDGEGNVWFTESAASRIGKITPAGTIAELALPPGRRPVGIAVGPEGDIWFTESGANRIGRIGSAGQITRFVVPGDESEPNSIALGPDGNLWFAERAGARVGKISPSGEVTEYDVPTEGGTRGIVAGPGGLLYFISGREIGAIRPDGVASWPSCLGEHCLTSIEAIALGPDGRLWAAAGEGHCLGLCGGGTGLSFAFDPGSIVPFVLPPLRLGIGPRLAPIHHDRTSVLLACGLPDGCRGTLQLGWYVYRHKKRVFVTFGRSAYALAAGESRRIGLKFKPKDTERLATFFGYEKYGRLIALAEGDTASAKRGLRPTFR